jgi:hypothetical protein
MVVGGKGLRAGFLASLPFVILNIATATTIAGIPPAIIITDTIITMILGAILGLLVAGVKKALFFLPISHASLAAIVGLAVGGILVYDNRPEVLLGHGGKSTAATYLGGALASTVAPLAAGLFWGLMMGGIYSVGLKKEPKAGVTTRLGGGLTGFLKSRIVPSMQTTPSPPPSMKAKIDRCAKCGRRRGILGGSVKFLACSRDMTIYCESCYTSFHRFGGITYACPVCGGALSPAK